MAFSTAKGRNTNSIALAANDLLVTSLRGGEGKARKKRAAGRANSIYERLDSVQISERIAGRKLVPAGTFSRPHAHFEEGSEISPLVELKKKARRLQKQKAKRRAGKDVIGTVLRKASWEKDRDKEVVARLSTTKKSAVGRKYEREVKKRLAGYSKSVKQAGHLVGLSDLEQHNLLLGKAQTKSFEDL